MHLVQVVADDVLDDLAAGLGYFTVGGGKAHPQHQVAGAAIQQPAGTARIRRQDTADGGLGGVGRVECQELTVRSQSALHRTEANTGLHRHRQVGRFVFEYPIQGMEA